MACQGARTQLSRELVALWADGYDPALALLRRIFPPGLMRYLAQRRAPVTSPSPKLPLPAPHQALPTPQVRPTLQCAQPIVSCLSGSQFLKDFSQVYCPFICRAGQGRAEGGLSEGKPLRHPRMTRRWRLRALWRKGARPTGPLWPEAAPQTRARSSAPHSSSSSRG